MLRGIYSVAYAMETAARNHEIAADNLVNATMPGFRRQGLLYETSAASEFRRAGDASGSQVNPRGSGTYTHFESGPLQQTQNPLDAAVSGDAFFVVQGPNGPLYTRNGAFAIGPGGVLQTRGGGYTVSGQGGQIVLPPGTGAITIDADGSITANGAQLGRLQLARFDNPQTLRRVGPTLFEGNAPLTPAPNSVRVEQGYRENSNVEPVREMISMMVGMRFYEAAGKAIQSMSDAVSQNTRPSQA